jgi:C4-dicarboxylate transporter DctQ subunit
MDTWDKFERAIAAITIAGAFILTFLEVVARFVFSYSFYWAKEYIIFFVIWSTFLGSSQVLKKSQHIRLSVFVDLLPEKGKQYFELLNIAMGLVFSIALVISGYNLIADAYVKGVTTTSLAKTPLWMPYMIMPIAGVLFCIRFLELFCNRSYGRGR